MFKIFKKLSNHQQLEDEIRNLYEKNLPPHTYPNS